MLTIMNIMLPQLTNLLNSSKSKTDAEKRLLRLVLFTQDIRVQRHWPSKSTTQRYSQNVVVTLQMYKQINVNDKVKIQNI